VHCEYAGSESETHGQALKRKYDDLKSLYELIKTTDEGEAREKFRQIRDGEEIEIILRGAQHYDLAPDANAAGRRRKFLSTLIQTTAPLSHLVRLASEILLSPQLVDNLPEVVAYEPLRDTVISIETLAGVLTRSNPNLSLLSLGRNLTPVRVADGFSGSPPYWVNATPWTTNVSDFAVSHLVSAFLAMVNGYWRFLEQDLFLKAMRSGRPSEYCSSFLVNAILACASVSRDLLQRFRGIRHVTAIFGDRRSVREAWSATYSWWTLSSRSLKAVEIEYRSTIDFYCARALCTIYGVGIRLYSILVPQSYRANLLAGAAYVERTNSGWSSRIVR
jgi:hypothetical protein